MLPAAQLTNLTVTGDVITAPGAPNVLIQGLPAACVGDVVAGPVCVGSITMGSFTVLIAGRPAARTTSLVVGANPITGIPVTTSVIGLGVTVLIGG
ncbi:PAAR domain-containing protein [Ancylothrix sp. C2]|uniref:PAAR domain-containing protein n=1 Tax=Ancylothrix sp. D3o TaxID=2953691 RepID=UPI0021BBAD43|nr:PAAR domain-containing protein [Ancylothrix sp. D3o]MCT7948229.1 PAAR domain-containing protein [Ancylothrix sp. D3o]